MEDKEASDDHLCVLGQVQAIKGAEILRDLAARVRAGELEGKNSLPYLLGAAAALEAQSDLTDDGSVSEAPPAST